MTNWMLPLAAVAIGCAAVLAWHYWPGDAARRDPYYSPDDARVPPRAAAEAAVPVGPPPDAGLATTDRGDDDAEAIVRRDCPWPVHPDTWRDLDERCLAAMARVEGEVAAELHRLIEDATATRQAVVAALDDPECRLPPLGPRDADIPWNRWPRWQGEPRPDLRGRCAAAAMVRLAELQVRCVMVASTDLDRSYWEDKASYEQAAAASISQEQYYEGLRRIEGIGAASVFWEAFLCRSVQEAWAWVDALPVPLGDPGDDRFNRPPYTQALDLYDAARRLGADVPEWAAPSAFEDHDFNPPVKEELPEGVYATEGLMPPPVRF